MDFDKKITLLEVLKVSSQKRLDMFGLECNDFISSQHGHFERRSIFIYQVHEAFGCQNERNTGCKLREKGARNGKAETNWDTRT